MKKIVKRNPLLLLLSFIPFAILGEYLHWNTGWIFIFSALGIVPLAGLIGEMTENLAHYTGARLGGLLNATFGNAAELIITIAAIRQGLLELVKASLTGSILGNLLLVLGMAMVIGGIKNKDQHFDRRAASRNAIMLVLTILILLIPSLLSHYIGAIDPQPSPKVEILSLGVAAVMVTLYILNLIYGFRIQGDERDLQSVKTANENNGAISLKWAVLGLLLATVGVAIMSEILVQTIEPIVESIGLSEFFIGVIFIPIIGNVAE
ncbi:MAG: calcium/proton exchanger, partial [Anaerolineales bacterium]